MKKQRNIRKKSDENLQKRRFPAYFWHFFSKIGLGHDLSIANAPLYAKNQKKLMMKSREMVKKPVFPAYFRHFRPEKYVFRKSGSVKFRHWHFASMCQISCKNKVQLEKFKKCRFSDEIRLFRRFLESSDYENQLN